MYSSMLQRENIHTMDSGIRTEVSIMEMTLKNRKILSKGREIDVLTWSRKE